MIIIVAVFIDILGLHVTSQTYANLLSAMLVHRKLISICQITKFFPAII